MGLLVKPVEAVRPYSVRTTVGEAADHAGYCGSVFYQSVLCGLPKVNDPVENRLRLEMTRSMPLEQVHIDIDIDG